MGLIGGNPPTIGVIFRTWIPPNKNGLCGGVVPLSPILVFGLDTGMEVENCDVKFDIP
jgi:hypothetical protein